MKKKIKKILKGIKRLEEKMATVGEMNVNKETVTILEKNGEISLKFLFTADELKECMKRKGK